MGGYDGTVRFDTKIDETGLKTGLAKLKGAITALGITASLAAVSAGFVQIGKSSIQAASNVQETANKFNVTFSSIADKANAAAENLSEGFGLSSQKAQQLLSDTGDLLTGFGFTQDAALDLSDQVNQLAVDLASFTNYSGGAEGASAALTSGLLGEREAMKSLGIAITEADIKQLAENKGIVGELDRQTKAMLTLELAMTQSKNAIGDFARSSDSYANISRQAEAATEDLAAAMGESLLPAATGLKRVYADIVSGIADVIEKNNELKAAMAADAAGTLTIEQQLLLEKQKLIEAEEAYNEVRAMGIVITADSPLRTELELRRRNVASLEETITRLEREDAMRKGMADAQVAQQENIAKAEEEAAERAEELAQRKIEDTERELAAQEASNEVARENYEREMERQAALAEYKREIREKEAEAERQALEELQQRRMDSLQGWSDYASSVSGIFSNLITSMTAGGEELTESQRKQLMVLFRMQQLANIAQITMDTAVAIMRGFAELGPIGGAIAKATTVLLGATQIAVVASAQPSFEVGAWNIPGEMTATLHPGETVLPAPFAEDYRRAVMSGGGGTTNSSVNVYVSGVVGDIEDVAVKIHEATELARQDGYLQ